MSRSKIIILLSIVIGIGAIGTLVFKLSKPINQSDAVVIVNITSSDSADVVRQLRTQGFRVSSTLFSIAHAFHGSPDLIVGERYLQKNISINSLITFLSNTPPVVSEKQIVIPEGWTVQEIATYLEDQKLIRAEDFISSAHNLTYWSEKFPFLKVIPKNYSLEGFLFPDTYRVFKDTTAEGIIYKMLQNFKEKILIAKEVPQDDNIYIHIKIASILEAEVKNYEDMRHVAGIITNRLNIGMGLQMDSTVNYVTKGTSARLTHEETKLDSPYNTYKHKGLPPTPIGNPGLDALRAAVYPEKNNYFFFLTDRRGTVYYAITHEEHVRNKQLYLK